MSDLSVEAEILRDNLIEEVTAKLGGGPVTRERLKAAVVASFSDAYANTLRDCMRIAADDQESKLTITLPPGLVPRS